MLIVCTKDPVVVATAQNPASGSDRWVPRIILNAQLNQAQATAAIARALRGLGADDPLCFSAHGNDYEIGDAGNGPNDWGWPRAEIALLLQQNAPGLRAPILIHACAEQISNFSAGLAVELERIRALNGVWIYGYNRPLPCTGGFPRPALMDRSVELQGTQVRTSASSSLRGRVGGSGCGRPARRASRRP